ncbi:MAG TPA: AsmA family protein [Rhodanobacteraceae bacterium]|nr:AsmA family protein [Rhodanobacteraceae bacterium]
MKRVLIGIAVVVLAVLVLGIGAITLVDADRFRPQIETALGEALGREVSLGTLHVAIWSGSLDADTIRIGDDPAFGDKPFVTARSLAVGVRLWPLLVHRQLHVTSLTLDQPTVRLQQDRAGRWNFASFGGAAQADDPPADPAAEPLALRVDKLRVSNGSIELTRAVGGARTYRDVTLNADQLGAGAAFPFSMSAAVAGGGTLQLDGRIGPWNATDAVLTPVDAHLVMHELDLVGAGLMSSADGVGGVLDVDTRIRSEQGVLRSGGRIAARQLKLVAAGSPASAPLAIDYEASYRLDQRTGVIENTTLGSGAAHLAVDGSFDGRGEALQLNLHLHGKQLPVDDLQALLPAFGVVLPKDSHLSGGTLDVDLRARGPLDALVIRGPVTLDDSRLAGFSLGSKLGTALSLAGIHAPKDTVIRHAYTALDIAPSGIRADPFNADITDLGHLTGKGHMAADGTLDFRMLVKLDEAVARGAGGDKGALGALLGDSTAGRALGGVLGGTAERGIGVRIVGTASTPSFKLDPSAVAGLLQAGLVGAASKDDKAPRDDRKSTRPKDVLGSLLRNALKSKKDDD